MKTEGVNRAVKAAIQEAVSAGLRAGVLYAERKPKDAYKDTEKRLYAYPLLLKKIVEDKARLLDMEQNGTPGRSKSLVRYSRSGARVSPEEMLEAMIRDLQARIAADEYEVETLGRALKDIADDPYFLSVKGKFLDGMTDDRIAETIPCDPSTVRRNRGRLVRKIAVLLYGVEAL